MRHDDVDLVRQGDELRLRDVVVGALHAHVGQRAHALQETREQQLRTARERAHAHGPAGSLTKPVDRGPGTLERDRDVHRRLAERRSRGGEAHAAAHALGERHAHGPLQLVHLLRDRRGRQVQHARRRGHAALRAHGAQRLQGACIHAATLQRPFTTMRLS